MKVLVTTKSKSAFYRRQFGISDDTAMSWTTKGLPPYAQKAIKDNFKFADWIQAILTFHLVDLKDYQKEDFEASWMVGYYPNDNEGDEAFESSYKGKQFEISTEKAEKLMKTNLFDFDNNKLVFKRIQAINLAYNTLAFIRRCFEITEGYDCLSSSYAYGLVLERLQRRLKKEGTLSPYYLRFSGSLGLAAFNLTINESLNSGAFIHNWKKLDFTREHKNFIRKKYLKKKLGVKNVALASP